MADQLGRGRKSAPPPLTVVTVKALACELPAQRCGPLSRYSTAELARVIAAYVDAPLMSRSTIWRILERDALKRWRHRSWFFPRDSHFTEKAGRVLDLYAGFWDGQPLHPNDCILSVDEKTDIQTRVRYHPSRLPVPRQGKTPRQPVQVEHEYERGGALAYLAAWDVRRGGIQGRCEATTGKAPCGRVVDQIMQQEPYRSGPRVVWIVDNGSSHQGTKAARELAARYPTLILVPLPIPAPWLNQIEIYFPIIQRKGLTPNDFAALTEVARGLLAYEDLYNRTAQPFTWTCTRQDLDRWLAQLEERYAHYHALMPAA